MHTNEFDELDDTDNSAEQADISDFIERYTHDQFSEEE